MFHIAEQTVRFAGHRNYTYVVQVVRDSNGNSVKDFETTDKAQIPALKESAQAYIDMRINKNVNDAHNDGRHANGAPDDIAYWVKAGCKGCINATRVIKTDTLKFTTLSAHTNETTYEKISAVAIYTDGRYHVIYDGQGLQRTVEYAATYCDRQLNDVKSVEVVYNGNVLAMYTPRS